MRRLRVLNAESHEYADSARAILRSFADLVEGQDDRAALLSALSAHDALIVRLGHRVDEEVLLSAPALRVIVSATTGLDHIDLEAAKRRGVDVLSLKGETEFLTRVTATAEHTWALLLALMRKVPAAIADVRDGHWRRDLFRGGELAGRTLGVIGYGRLGRMVARYGLAFDMRVLVYDTRPSTTLSDGIGSCTLEQLIAEADVVSLHVPLDATTRGMIGRTEIARMKKGSILLNSSRGEIIDSEALLDALARGHLAGAGLDVVPDELPGTGTMSTNRLVEYARRQENLLVTPHIGGATWESMRKTEEFMADRLRQWAALHGFVG